MSGTLMQSDWHELYREALMESDPEKVPALIEVAQKAIQHRALELWYRGSQETKEHLELDAALYFLGLLRTIGPIDSGGSQGSNFVKQTYN